MPPWLESHPLATLAAISLVAFIESFALIGIVVPGVVLLFSLAALASQLSIGLPWVLTAAALGACAGDLTSFFIGRWLQHRVDHLPWFRYHQRWLEQGEWFFRRWGWLSVIIGRFVGPIRPVVPLVAGTLNMPRKLFIGLNLVSVTAWAPAYMLPGYFTGEMAHLMEAQPQAERLLLVAAVTASCLLLVVLTINHHIHPEHPRTARWLPFLAQIPPRFPFSALTLALVCGACLVWLTMARPLAWDVLLSDQVPAWRATLADDFFIGFTMLGDPTILTLTGLMITLWFCLKGYYWLTLHLLGTIALALWGLFELKALFGVVRPDWVTTQPLGDAFPSGHAAGFALFVGLLAAFINESRPALVRWQVYLPAGVLMVLMAFSRVWLGVHWLSDVTAGVLLALLFSALARLSYTSLTAKRFNPRHSLAFWVLVSLVFAAYIRVNWEHAHLAYTLKMITDAH